MMSIDPVEKHSTLKIEPKTSLVALYITSKTKIQRVFIFKTFCSLCRPHGPIVAALFEKNSKNVDFSPKQNHFFWILEHNELFEQQYATYYTL